MESDVWLTDDGCHFTDATFGLWQTPTPFPSDGANWLAYLWFNKGCTGNAIAGGINIGLPGEEVFGFMNGAYTPNEWNRGRIVVRTDYRIEFYVRKPGDSGFLHLWTSRNPLDTSFSGHAAFMYLGKEGGGPARADNVLIQEYVGCDCNNNGMPDDCEFADRDGDGVIDDCDNCPDDSNFSQADFDRDGSGDACDDDIDNDKVANELDVCDYTPTGANIITDPRPPDMWGAQNDALWSQCAEIRVRKCGDCSHRAGFSLRTYASYSYTSMTIGVRKNALFQRPGWL